VNVNGISCRKPYPEPVSLRRPLGVRLTYSLESAIPCDRRAFGTMVEYRYPFLKIKGQGGDILARSKFQSEKRQKEVAKKKKQEEKRQRKLAKNTPSPDDNHDQPQDAAESSSAEGGDVLVNP